MPFYENALVRLDQGVWGGVWRVAAGFAAGVSWNLLFGHDRGDRGFVVYFLAILVTLRLAAAVLRRVARVSRSSREIWAARRLLGKRYDSYQWRKLLWIGCGLLLYALIFGRYSRPVLAVTLGCLLSGAFGVIAWRRRSRELEAIGGPPATA